jgi:hypothetical protein
MDDLLTLLERIDLLLGVPAAEGGDSADVRAHIETTLTDGYARALALEAEHWRLQREIAAIAAEIAEAREEPRTRELAALVRRLKASEEELGTLRDTLRALRGRLASGARAA